MRLFAKDCGLLRWLLRHFSWWLSFSLLQAQTLEVEVPESPPRDFLYHASEGNLYFETYHAKALSQELRKFYEETGFAVYVVTVNSPPKKVMENLQQQVKTKWKDSRDCMVIFYDLDTRMLAVQFEQFYRERDGMMMPSKLLGVSEQAWVEHVDQWMKKNDQNDGLAMSQSLTFFRDFLTFMRTELAKVNAKKTLSRGWYIALAVVILLAFSVYWWLQTFAKKLATDVEYHFPSMHMNQRLKARFGGGMLTVRQMSPPRSLR